MKRLIAIIAIVALILSFAVGCTAKKPQPDKPGNQIKQEENTGGSNTYKPENTPDNAPEEIADDPGNSYLSGTPSNGYSSFTEAKYNAYDKLTAKMNDNPELVWYTLSLLPFTMIDLRLITIGALTSNDEATAKMALSFFFENVDCSFSGDTYTITYSDNEGNKYTDTCVYDAAKDSMKVTTSDGSGNELLFFEYVKIAEGSYAAQYYYEEDGSFEMLALYFDNDVIALGSKQASSKPASIFGDTGIGMSFVKGCDSYYILDGEKFTIFDEGTETVY